MKKRRGGEEGISGDSWLNTYADMVTLILTFFVLLISISTINQEKFNAFIRSFIGSLILEESPYIGDPDAVEEDAMTDLYLKLSKYVTEHNQEDAVFLMQNEDVVYVRFSSSAFFEPDQYVFREESKPTIEFIGQAIKEYEDDIDLVTIFGHTADADTPVSDWMLSGERAAMVAIQLEEVQKFDEKKIVILGYGNNYPVADNSTEEGRQANRRVELAIIGKKSENKFDPYGVLKELYDAHTYPKAGDTEEILIPPTSSIAS